MAQVAVVVLAGTETHEDLARVVNALEAAKEFKESDDDIKVIFDGAATAWLPKLMDSGHKVHPLFLAVKDKIAGACSYCSGAFQTKESIGNAGFRLLDEYEGHSSFKNLMDEGYQVITF